MLLLTGCASNTKVVTQYKTVERKPPPALISPCLRPFDSPPQTYGEAVERDPVWHASWRTCANQIQQLRQFYGIQ
ncbi:Rz1-like lysis system protein LysC [Vibrio rumoiensis]